MEISQRPPSMEYKPQKMVILDKLHMDMLLSKLEEFVLDTLEVSPISSSGLMRRVEVMDLIQVIRSKVIRGQLKNLPRTGSRPNSAKGKKNPIDRTGIKKRNSENEKRMETEITSNTDQKETETVSQSLLEPTTNQTKGDEICVHTVTTIGSQTRDCVITKDSSCSSSESHIASERADLPCGSIEEDPQSTPKKDNATSEKEETTAEESDDKQSGDLKPGEKNDEMNYEESDYDLELYEKVGQEIEIDNSSLHCDEMTLESVDNVSITSTMSPDDMDVESPSPSWSDGEDQSDSDMSSEEEWPQVTEVGLDRPRRKRESLIALVDNMLTIPEERLSVASSLASDKSSSDGDEAGSHCSECTIIIDRSEYSSLEETTSTDDLGSLTSGASDMLAGGKKVNEDNTTKGMMTSREGCDPWEDDCQLTTIRRIRGLHLQVEESRCLKYSQEALSRLEGAPPWPAQSHQLQKVTYCSPLDARFINRFIILPKTGKTSRARLMTFSENLQGALREVATTTMGSANMELCDSGFMDIVSQSGLVNPDYRGWLLDIETGQKKWCVVADMLFCMFDDEHDEKPMKTLLLPGHEVKGIVFTSAKRGAFPESSHGNQTHHTRAHKNTISGQIRYQFVLENQCTQEDYVFGAESQDDLDTWMSILKVAINLDSDLFTDSSSEGDGSSLYNPSFDLPSSIETDCSNSESASSDSVGITSASCESKKDTSLSESPTPTRYLPSMVKSATTDNSDISSPDCKNSLDIETGKVSTRLQRQKKIVLDESDLPPTESGLSNGGPPSRYQPSPSLLPKRLEKNLSRENSEDAMETGLSGASGPVFARVIRCNSCKELRHNVSLSSVPKEKEKPRKTRVITRQSSFDNIKTLLRLKTSDREPKEPKVTRLMRSRSEVVKLNASTGGSEKLSQSLPASRTTSPYVSEENVSDASSGSRQGLGSRLAQKANSLKERMFGSHSKSSESEGNARLGTLIDIEQSGFLDHKHLLKWVRMWCVVANGYFYAYRSCFPGETPITSVLLKDCSLSLVEGEKYKRMYTFKLCQLNVRGLYFSDDDHLEFKRWMNVLTKGTSTYESFQHGLTYNARDSIDSMISAHSSDSQENQHSPKSSQSDNCKTPQSDIHISNSLQLSTTGVNTSQVNASSLHSDTSKAESRATANYKTSASHTQLRIKIPKPQQAKGPIRAQSTGCLEVPVSPAPVSSRSIEPSPTSQGPHQGLVKRRTLVHGTPNSSVEGQESGFSSLSENNLQNSSFSISTPSSEGSLVVGPGVVTSDTDSDCPDSTFDDIDVTSPESMTSSMTSSMSSSASPGLFASLPKIDSQSPTNENAPKNVARLDKNIQLHLLKNQVEALPNRPGRSIFNRHLPGPNNEGLLLVREENQGPEELSGMTTTNSKKHLTELRRFSLSDGSLSSPLMAQLRGMVGGERVSRAPDPSSMAARDIESPQLSGYLDRKHNTPGWDNVWCIVKDSILYIYASPIDEVAMDMVLLPGYEVRQCDIIMDDKEYVLELYHEEYQSEYYSCDSMETLQRWQQVLANSAQKVTIDGLNLEQGQSSEFDQTHDTVKAAAMASEKQWEQELLQLKKQQLLEEVLQQKMQLEANLRLQDRANEPVDGDKLIKEMVQLKQRKASLNIKIGGVQRALSVYQHQKKKKRFRFPGALGSKSPKSESDKATPEEEFLENTMKDLNGELEAIEKDIKIKMVDSQLAASLPEKEVRAVQAAQREKTNNGFLSSVSNSKDKSRDKKNKYSGALKFLNPHFGEAEDGHFRTRAHTVASPRHRDMSSSQNNLSGSCESLKKRDYNSSSESLRLLKNLNDVSISNASVRHSWSYDKNPGRPGESSPSSSYGNISKIEASNGYVKANGFSNSPPAIKTSPLAQTWSPSSRSDIGAPLHHVVSTPELHQAAAPKDVMSVTPERPADTPLEVSAEALAHIAEFEDLLKEQNVLVL